MSAGLQIYIWAENQRLIDEGRELKKELEKEGFDLSFLNERDQIVKLPENLDTRILILVSILTQLKIYEELKIKFRV